MREYTQGGRAPGYGERWAVAVLAACAAVLWLPALSTPFWGDDYSYLYQARLANQAGQPWLETFWPAQPLQFWRPLSQEAWWRLVDARLGAEARVAHACVLALHLAASAAVGVLAAAMGRRLDWPRPRLLGALATVLYAVAAVGLLPVHWVAAANSPLLVLFTALALWAWLRSGWAATLPAAVGWGGGLLALQAAALLSKESAVLTPLLMAWLALFCPMPRRRFVLVVGLACTLLTLAWLVLRSQATGQPDAHYAYAFGGNLLRNAATLPAWLLNVPREAMRMLVIGPRGPALLWIVATALPMLLAWFWACRGGGGRFSARQWALLLAFPVLAYAPYFPLSWNSYEYYAAVAAIVPTIALARLLMGRRRLLPAVVLVALSAWLAVAGSRWLEPPSLIGRARWAEATLQALSRQRLEAPLWLRVEDDQRFAAIGVAGLAWRLGLDPGQIHPVPTCPPVEGSCLSIAADGRWTLTGPGEP